LCTSLADANKSTALHWVTLHATWYCCYRCRLL